MRTVSFNVYDYSELSDEAKVKARDWYRTTEDIYEGLEDQVTEDLNRIAEIIGIRDIELLYSGFSSQGDGACFTGVYRYKAGAVEKLKEEFPSAIKLHWVAEALESLKKEGSIEEVEITHSGRYYHNLMVDYEFSNWPTEEEEEDFKEAMREIMDWAYKSLEATFWDRCSDEFVADSLIGSNYEFCESGERFEQ